MLSVTLYCEPGDDNKYCVGTLPPTREYSAHSRKYCPDSGHSSLISKFSRLHQHVHTIPKAYVSIEQCLSMVTQFVCENVCKGTFDSYKIKALKLIKSNVPSSYTTRGQKVVGLSHKLSITDNIQFTFQGSRKNWV